MELELNGTYRGLSPTDESGVGVGELEVVIDDRHVKYRFATGLKVESERVSRSDLRKLADDEVLALFNEGADVADVVGYGIRDDGPIFLFLRHFPAESPDEPEPPQVVIIRLISDEVDSIFGRSQLFTPQQVKAGHYKKTLAIIEASQGDPGVVPRLSNKGKRR